VRRSYLLVYSDTLGTRDQLKALLSELEEVVTWRYDLPHSFYIISDEDANTLAKAIRVRRGNKGRFIITEIASNKQGWLTPESWYLINKKKRKPKSGAG
jgi:hypothetical protein